MHKLFPSPQALLLGFVAFAAAGRAEIPEPDTIFYGQVINRTSGAAELVTQGSLVWTIARPDGSAITLSSRLQSLNNGLYSYSLAVPQEALAYGLSVSSNAIPLSANSASCSHAQITVDGSPAALLAPGKSTFTVSQGARAATYRLDLELFNPLPETGGTGLPDWWKSLYGITDPNADPTHDGWTALQDFLLGANPTNDHRIPSLATRELFVYGDGTTGLRLQALDSDSAPTNLTYTLIGVPQTGTVYLRNATTGQTNSDAALKLGSTFTQEDVNRGRLIFVHNGAASVSCQDTLAVTLQDENPTHPATNGTVTLNVYRPDYPAATLQLAESATSTPAGMPLLSGLSVDEQQMMLNYFLSRDQGFVVFDSSRAASSQNIRTPSSGLTPDQYRQYVAQYGPDRRHLLIGGSGDDYLVGSMESDILISSRGNDRLRGNGGSDLFVISSPGGTNCTIEDFNVSENDVLDISRLLSGTSDLLTNYVQLSNDGANSYLSLNFQGGGAPFTNMIITLLGNHLAQSDLRALVDNGNLIAGTKTFAPRIAIAANVAAASRNGPIAGQFTLTRSGDTNTAITVSLQITGSAVNGSDYQFITPQVTLAPGQRTAVVSISPYPSSITTTQMVQVAIQPGSGYEVGSVASAQITIEPLAPQLSIEALEPVASKTDQTSGLFLVTRSGAVDRSVFVRLTIGGTAPASHYAAISPYLNFAPQQTTALISITPNPSAVISNGAESVQITLNPDPAYKLMGANSARVLIVDRMLTLAQWQQQNFPAWTNGLTAFMAADPSHTGIANLNRYAFGLDPLNPQSSNGIPAYRILNDQLTVSFKRPAAISDLDYSIEVSGDLLSWSSSTNDVEQFYPAANNDAESVSYRSTQHVSQTPKLFMRVRVSPR